MVRFASSFRFATSAAAVLALAVDAWAEEYVCQSGETVRRVELRFADPQEPVPCEVVYWKDTEEPGEPRVLWHARSSVGFCERKALELVQTLESGGWSCRASRAGIIEAQPEARPSPAPAAALNGPAAETDRGELEKLLQQAIDRDLARLNELTRRGRFDATISALGDLDGDGTDDAAVIMTYADGTEQLQYLIAYMFRGNGYLPVAKMPIGDWQQGPAAAEVAAIEDGAIRLQLQPAESRNGNAGRSFVVQDGRLVEVPTS